jgi:hypothetical protein
MSKNIGIVFPTLSELMEKNAQLKLKIATLENEIIKLSKINYVMKIDSKGKVKS